MTDPTPATDMQILIAKATWLSADTLAGDVIRSLIARIASERQRRERVEAELERAQQDINWMLNERKFLNPGVFDYIEAALKGEQKDE